LARDLIKLRPDLKLTSVVVSEAGASVYSASEFASRELPDMTSRARRGVHRARLQDPLAELVKIDPKSIAVGQYQHDVSQFPVGAFARCGGGRLRQRRRRGRQHGVGALCWARVSGLSSSVAAGHRQPPAIPRASSPAVRSCATCRAWARRTFEQAAASCASWTARPARRLRRPPESYPLVQTILADIKQDLKGVIGTAAC